MLETEFATASIHIQLIMLGIVIVSMIMYFTPLNQIVAMDKIQISIIKDRTLYLYLIAYFTGIAAAFSLFSFLISFITSMVCITLALHTLGTVIIYYTPEEEEV